MERGQTRLPDGRIVDEDDVITYDGHFETVTMPAWQLDGYIRKETEKWIMSIPSTEAIRVVNLHKSGYAAILNKFGLSGYDSFSRDIWDDLPDNSTAKAEAAYAWMWDKFEKCWDIHDFMEV